MSNLHDLFEARSFNPLTAQRAVKRSTRTADSPGRTTDRPEPDFADVFGSKTKFQAPSVQTKGQVPAQAPAPGMRRSGAEDTRRAMTDVNMPPEAADKMGMIQQMQNSDEITDIEARHRAGFGDVAQAEPETTGQDLAVISKDIASKTDVDPKWHDVKHLPGYLSSSIRAMGRQVFGTFTDTPIEDINVVASIGGGPNSEDEVGAVINWLHQNATPDSAAKMHFEKTIPDYGAEMIVFKTDSDTFLAVKDPMGSYVYSWPTSDELERIEGRKQLR